jgi:hypothetical protein
VNAAFHVVLALGFGNLAMLGWLAAAAAPLLIHLWSRHRFREAPWAAMQFLLAAMRKNARRMQLQQWLLLAVRTLIIALVVLAVAEPYGERLMAGGSTAPTHKVLVIDGTYSMAYCEDDGTRFARAKRLAVELVRNSRSGDVFSVILLASPARTILGPELIDHTAVATQIESLAISHSGAEMADVLRLVDEALTAKVKDRKLPEQQEVFFFTDLQQIDWASDDQNRSGAGSVKGNPTSDDKKSASQLAALAQKVPVTVIDVAQPSATNLAVTQLSTSDPFVTPGRDVTFDVVLHQFGQAPVSKCRAEFLVDGIAAGEQTADIPAGGDASLRFTHRFTSPGTHTVSIRTTGDRLEIDNSRWLVLPVRKEVRVLCVSGREGAAKFVADALQPNPDSDSAIVPVVVSEGDLVELNLADFDSIFICNVAQLSDGGAQRLSRFMEAGGGVVFFLGDRVVPENYNGLKRGLTGTGGVTSTADDQTTAPPLLPARIGEVVANTSFGLDPLEYRHPIVVPFRGRERAGLLTTPIARYHRLSLSEDNKSADVAVATRTGDPFIVTALLGRGRVALVATDASLTSVDPATGEPWTTWPTWPSFLPIIRELLAYSGSGRHDLWQYPVGATISGTMNNFAASAPTSANVKLLRPDGRTDPISIQSTPPGAEWSYTNTDISGIYALQGVQPNQVLQFAVNVDTAESDLSKADPKSLPPEVSVRQTASGSSDANSSSVISQSAWSQSVLWLVVGLLFAESFMAWRFGRGGQ